MKHLIGSRYGVLFGCVIGTLVDEFGLGEVEAAFATILGAIRTALSSPASEVDKIDSTSATVNVKTNVS